MFRIGVDFVEDVSVALLELELIIGDISFTSFIFFEVVKFKFFDENCAKLFNENGNEENKFDEFPIIDGNISPILLEKLF